MDTTYYVALTDDVYVDTNLVAGFEFKNAVWNQSSKSKIVLAQTMRTKCIIHFAGGGTMSFELPDDVTPADIVDRLDTLPYNDAQD